MGTKDVNVDFQTSPLWFQDVLSAALMLRWSSRKFWLFSEELSLDHWRHTYLQNHFWGWRGARAHLELIVVTPREKEAGSPGPGGAQGAQGDVSSQRHTAEHLMSLITSLKCQKWDFYVSYFLHESNHRLQLAAANEKHLCHMIKAGRYLGLDHISWAALNLNMVLLLHVEEQKEANPGWTGLLQKENWNQVRNLSWWKWE